MKKFTKKMLKNVYLKELLTEFWFVPHEALLRAPEMTIYKNINFHHPVLDIGCGDGDLDKYVFRGKTIDVGMDNNENAIERAKKSGFYKSVSFEDAEHMSFKDNSFAMVISNSTFEHIKNDKKAVSEVARVIKPGGSFIFTTTTDRLKNQLEKIGIKGDKLKKYDERVQHYHYRRVSEWKIILQRVGLNIEYLQYYFPIKNVKPWWNFYKITVFKPYRRELWSYLKDSPYGKLFPNRLITRVCYQLLKNYYNNSFSEDGVWIYIKAIKK